MIPAGYMYKNVMRQPDWLKNDVVEDIYSMSRCVSKNFADFSDHWLHNGYWLFDFPEIMEDIAEADGISLKEASLFFYEFYEYQHDERDGSWATFEPFGYAPEVTLPKTKILEGYDVVSFSMQNIPEHSFLSCNLMARTINVNKHCLLDSFEEAKSHIESDIFVDCEPGPCTIVAVYSVPNDK